MHSEITVFDYKSNSAYHQQIHDTLGKTNTSNLHHWPLTFNKAYDTQYVYVSTYFEYKRT